MKRECPWCKTNTHNLMASFAVVRQEKDKSITRWMCENCGCKFNVIKETTSIDVVKDGADGKRMEKISHKPKSP